MDLNELILEYSKALAWPLTLIGLILAYRRQIADLFGRTKKLELPGGISIEIFEEKIEEAKELAKIIETKEKQSSVGHNNGSMRTLNHNHTNKRMVELGLTPSPSGLEVSYYHKLAQEDLKLALASLRIDLEIMLKNIAKVFDVKTEEVDSISFINRKLLHENAISHNQYELIKRLIEIANATIKGAKITDFQADELFKIMKVLINDYKFWLSRSFEEV